MMPRSDPSQSNLIQCQDTLLRYELLHLLFLYRRHKQAQERERSLQESKILAQVETEIMDSHDMFYEEERFEQNMDHVKTKVGNYSYIYVWLFVCVFDRYNPF